jgi:hypothetical protein
MTAKDEEAQSRLPKKGRRPALYVRLHGQAPPQPGAPLGLDHGANGSL